MTNGKNVFVDIKYTNKDIYDKIVNVSDKLDNIEKKILSLKWHDKILYLGQAVMFTAIGILFSKF